MGNGTEKRIEKVREGDAVLSCYGSGDFRSAKVVRVHRHRKAARLVRLTLASGRTVTSTPQHVHFAGYRFGITPQTHFVYLMEKKGVGFRLGTSQVYTKGQQQPVIGFLQRSRQEHADAAWVISAHQSEPEARFEETRLSLSYGIPTIPFVPRKGKGNKGLVHDAEAIARLYACLDTQAAAQRMLEDNGLSVREPHHQAQSRNALRRNVVVTLCGDRRGRTPMHRISIVGNDMEGAHALAALGFSVRPAKQGSRSWRVETAKATWSEIAADVERMREAFELNVMRQARFGVDNRTTDGRRGSNSLPFRRAASIRPGMVVFTREGYDIVSKVDEIADEMDVVDLDIEATHNFVGNGIVTHNSIYGWRGAEVDNILRFEKDFPGAKVIRLERNYRSTGHILGAAAGLIANNKGRLGKTLFTDGEVGRRPTVTGVWDDEEEARAIGEAIEALRKDHHPLNQIAILVRASFQMRVLEDRFITMGLAYRVIGGPRFYERQEIRDAVAYLEITANPANDLKFERIVNVPKRGLGDSSIKRIHELSRARQMPLFQAARELAETEELAPKARRSLAGLIAHFQRWQGLIETTKHTELAELILDESGYTAMWQADKSPQAQSRLENLKELVRFMHEFETLAGFLEHVSLVMDTEQADDGDRVSIMTLHGAKGLEFDTVFLPGWEEGLFPHQRSLDEQGLAGLEEERRLAYVGLTRARKQAHVSFAQNRRTRGLFQSASPSRFIDELPEDHVEVAEVRSPFGGAYAGLGRASPYGRSRFDEGPGAFRSSYETPGWQRAKQQAAGGAGGGSAGTAGRPGRSGAGGGGLFGARRSAGPLTIEGELIASSTVDGAGYAVGDRVRHQKFGPGTVEVVDGNKLTIAFDGGDRKRVVASFVERE
jgi:DNA helicase-2/ATP-dependent DNA helicase PcrA